MLNRVLIVVIGLAMSVPARAGDGPVPSPEAGIGFGSIALMGAAYIFFRKRFNKD